MTFKGAFGYRLVNHEGRGGIPERNRAHEWLKGYGLDVGAADKFVPQSIFTAPKKSVRLFLQALFGGDGGLYHTAGSVYLEYYSKSRRLIEDVHHLLLRFGIFSLIREKTTAIGTRACSIQITDKDQVARFAAEVGFVPWVRQAAASGREDPAAHPRQAAPQEQLRQSAGRCLGAHDDSRQAVGCQSQLAWHSSSCGHIRFRTRPQERWPQRLTTKS